MAKERKVTLTCLVRLSSSAADRDNHHVCTFPFINRGLPLLGGTSGVQLRPE